MSRPSGSYSARPGFGTAHERTSTGHDPHQAHLRLLHRRPRPLRLRRGPAAVSGRPAEALPDDLRPVPDPGYDAWVAAFRPRAASRGISDQTLAAAFRSAGFLPGAITRDRDQPESSRTLEDYLSIAVSDERVAKGRAAYAANRGTLDAVAGPLRRRPDHRHRDLGPRELLRRAPRRRPVVSATSTLAYEGRRGAFFEEQLTAALRILDRRRHHPRADDRLLGRRDGPHPVHPDLLPRLRRRLHRRRPPRHLVRRSDRHPRLDRRLPRPLRLDARRAVGRHGRQRRARRHRHPAPARRPELLGHRQLPRHQALQQLRPLRDRRRRPRRPHRRRRPPAGEPSRPTPTA